MVIIESVQVSRAHFKACLEFFLWLTSNIVAFNGSVAVN